MPSTSALNQSKESTPTTSNQDKPSTWAQKIFYQLIGSQNHKPLDLEERPAWEADPRKEEATSTEADLKVISNKEEDKETLEEGKEEATSEADKEADLLIVVSDW